MKLNRSTVLSASLLLASNTVHASRTGGLRRRAEAKAADSVRLLTEDAAFFSRILQGDTSMPPVPQPTNPPTEAPVSAPTLPAATDPPVAPPTAAPVVPPTDAPVVPPTDAPVVPPTDAPVVPPTDAPVADPTVAPVVPPTEAPVAPPTMPPTDPPSTCPVTVSKQKLSHYLLVDACYRDNLILLSFVLTQ